MSPVNRTNPEDHMIRKFLKINALVEIIPGTKEDGRGCWVGTSPVLAMRVEADSPEDVLKEMERKLSQAKEIRPERRVVNFAETQAAKAQVAADRAREKNLKKEGKVPIETKVVETPSKADESNESELEDLLDGVDVVSVESPVKKSRVKKRGIATED